MEKHLDIQHNKELNRWDLHFVKTPNDDLSNYLERLGYRYHPKKPRLYFAPHHDAYKFFAQDLKEVLKNNQDYKDIVIRPSHIPHESNIIHNKFSYVTISYQKGKSVDKKNFVVFDQYKRIAEAIGQQYGERVFKEKYVSVEAAPRIQKKKAKDLLEANLVIIPLEKEAEAIDKKEVSKTSKSDDSKKSLTNNKGVYTKETSGDRYERLEVPIPKNAKYEVAIKLVKDNQNKYRFGTDIQKNFGDHSSTSSPVSNTGESYPTKKEALHIAFSQIISRMQSQIETKDYIISDQDKKNRLLQKALKATVAFAKKLGVSLESKTLAKEPKTKKSAAQPKKSNTKQEKNKTISKKTKTSVKSNPAHKKNGSTEPQGSQSSEVSVLSKYRIVQKWTTIGEDMLSDFQELIDTQSDALYFTYLPSVDGSSDPKELQVLKVGIESDRDTIWFLYAEKTDSLIIDRLKVKSEGIVSYSGSAIPMGKLKSAIRYMIANPETLVIKPFSIAPYKDLYKALEKDIEKNGILIPNVLIPKGVINTIFEAGTLVKQEEELAEHFPKLFALTDATLETANPRQLFALAQLEHPEDFGIAVSSRALRLYWQSNGERIFKGLGYPVEKHYPYVHLNTGYLNVRTLGTILSGSGGRNQWLSAAAGYRPIADMEKAISILDEKIKELLDKRAAYIDPEIGTAKTTSPDAEIYSNLSEQIQKIQKHRDTVTNYQNATKEVTTDKVKETTQEDKKQPLTQNDSTSEVDNFSAKTDAPSNIDAKKSPLAIEVAEATEVTANPIPCFVSSQEAQRIRRQFNAKGFMVPYTGKQAFSKNVSLSELAVRQGYNQLKLETKIEKEYGHWISILEKEIKVLEGKEDRKSKQSKIHRLERIKALQNESQDLETLVANEHKVFKDELFTELVERARQYEYIIKEDDMTDFRSYMSKELFEGSMFETSPDMPIGKAVRILLDNYFPKEKEEIKEVNDLSYMDKVIAIMHDHYMEARRLSRKKVEEIKNIASVPNLGMLWEAVELSWLLWYKFYYQEPVSFENRLAVMIRFWNEVQPTYHYSDSSKEQYKQYSTPGPIGAIIAEYTNMGGAARTFEPSAGNGLLVLGADPQKTHVNEIDKNRRNSLQKQGFHTITHFNAAEPLPEELTKSFDVMVTNPPFAAWDADDFDKKRIVRKYFNSYRRLDKNRLRLEHVMSGLALHTLKDSGKAALILMGHIYFDDKGFIAKARPFFNWLYMHYHVDDVINLNSFKLYNKQGAVTKTMLVLIGGRKRNPTNKAIAPTRKQAASLDAVVDSFSALWERVKSHIKTPLEILIQKLKIEIGDDIL